MELKEVMAVRNAMVGTTDLRQPLNLGDQLLHKSGLSTEVGQAMIDLLQVTASFHDWACKRKASFLTCSPLRSGCQRGIIQHG